MIDSGKSAPMAHDPVAVGSGQIDRGKQNLLGILIDAVNYEAAVEKIIGAARDGVPYGVSALAVHGVMTGVQDPEHGYRLNQLDLVAPDGQPVRWALNLLHGVDLPDRVYGPTLTLKVCERAAAEGLPVFLYGSRPEVLQRFADNLQRKFAGLQIAGVMPSRFRAVTAEEQQEIAAEIRASGAKIVLVGLGCPRQEVWVYENRALLNMPLMAVGAAFDFHAGTLSQAPKVLQDFGLEWFYRFVHEPRRLWRRYLLLNPQYVWLVIRQILRREAFPVAVQVPPTREMRFG